MTSALELLRLEADPDLPEERLAPTRTRCRALYDAYVARWGPLNRCTISDGRPDPETGLPTRIRRRPAMGGFRSDPDLVTVLALERYDDATGSAEPAPILTRRVNHRPRRPDRVATPTEAVAVCLDRHGRLDLATIGQMLDEPAEDVPALLSGVAFEDPTDGRWVPAEEYLSGNVVAKLRAAETAAVTGDRFRANVSALAAVLPRQLEPHEIAVHLGAPWVPPADIEAFVRDMLGTRVTVSHEPVTATWGLDVHAWTRTADATVTWGTSRVDAFALTELALNSAAPTVYDEIVDANGRTRRVRNTNETMLACERQDAIQARFRAWVWEDPDRADRLAGVYNDLFASHVARRFDGSHLTFPGLAAGFTPHPWQHDIAWRIASTPAALCAHDMGAGKTASMFLSAMTLRRLGLARLPMIVVPNHLLEQVARDGQSLFPLARILMVTKEDLRGERRRGFAARVATGDWDAVVITHSQFTSLPTLPATEARYLAERIAQFRQATMANDGARSAPAKQLAKALDRLEQRHRTLLHHRTDDGLCFEQLGVDFVLVDEAHYFKNLATPTRTQMTLPASKRAEDLALKLWWLKERNHGRRWAALFTGTPISNTLAELFVMQRYLQPDRLAELRLDLFDAWAAQFIQFETAVEVAPDGSGFRLHRRPRRFQNVPDLRRLLAEVADIRSRHALGLDAPDVVHDTVVTAPSAEVVDIIAGLVRRADAIRQGRARRNEDCMLQICTEGRLAALDPALVGRPTTEPTKIDAAVANIAAIYHRTAKCAYRTGDGALHPRLGALQIVFCDLGTPKDNGDTQTYGKIRSGMAADGVPIDRIRFVHEARTDSAKAALFAACRTGAVSVLIASTTTAGIGTNIQDRAVALHHIDAPWMPAEVNQREARAVRPGNQNDTVEIYRYVTERSFDAFTWQAIARKAGFIAQILAGDLTDREVEDVGAAAMGFTEVMAAATGNALVLEHAEAAAALTRLRHLEANHRRNQLRLRREAHDRRIEAEDATATARCLDALVAAADPTSWFQPRHGDRITAQRTLPAALTGAAQNAWERRHGRQDRQLLGVYRGLSLTATAVRAWRRNSLVLSLAAPGQRPVTVAELDPGQCFKAGKRNALVRALDAFIADAGPRAATTRALAAELADAAGRARAMIDQPFTHAAELAAADARLHDLDEAIARAAASDDHAPGAA